MSFGNSILIADGLFDHFFKLMPVAYSNLLNTRYGYIKQHGTQKVDLIKFVMDEIINMAFQ